MNFPSNGRSWSRWRDDCITQSICKSIRWLESFGSTTNSTPGLLIYTGSVLRVFLESVCSKPTAAESFFQWDDARQVTWKHSESPAALMSCFTDLLCKVAAHTHMHIIFGCLGKWKRLENGRRSARKKKGFTEYTLLSWLGCSPAPIDCELMANGRQQFFQKFSSWKLKSCVVRMFSSGQHTWEFQTLQLPLTTAQISSKFSSN